MGTKPMKTQDLNKHDLRKFLKRVSTPLGTKSFKSQGVITTKDSSQATKRKSSKTKCKPKRPSGMPVTTKHPLTQPGS